MVRGRFGHLPEPIRQDHEGNHRDRGDRLEELDTGRKTLKVEETKDEATVVPSPPLSRGPEIPRGERGTNRVQSDPPSRLPSSPESGWEPGKSAGKQINDRGQLQTAKIRRM